jgi:hypothetical protein
VEPLLVDAVMDGIESGERADLVGLWLSLGCNASHSNSNGRRVVRSSCQMLRICPVLSISYLGTKSHRARPI